MDKNGQLAYSKKIEALIFSTAIGLIFGECFTISLDHPILNFSQFLVNLNHLSPFMTYFLWFSAAFLINVFLGGAFAGFILSIIKKDGPLGSSENDDDYDDLPDWWVALSKKTKRYKAYKWYLNGMLLLFFIDPLLTTIIFFNK